MNNAIEIKQYINKREKFKIQNETIMQKCEHMTVGAVSTLFQTISLLQQHVPFNFRQKIKQ